MGFTNFLNTPYDRPIAFIVLNDDIDSTEVSPDTIINDVQSGLNPLNDPEMLEESHMCIIRKH